MMDDLAWTPRPSRVPEGPLAEWVEVKLKPASPEDANQILKAIRKNEDKAMKKKINIEEVGVIAECANALLKYREETPSHYLKDASRALRDLVDRMDEGEEVIDENKGRESWKLIEESCLGKLALNLDRKAHSKGSLNTGYALGLQEARADLMELMIRQGIRF